MSKGLREVNDEVTSALIVQIEAIDAQLSLINVLMSRMQPWHSGRLGVGFENADLGRKPDPEDPKKKIPIEGPGRTVPKGYEYFWNSKMELWNHKKHGAAGFSLKVKSKGAFAANTTRIRELVHMVMHLMKLRASLVGSLMNYKKSFGEHMKKAVVMKDYAATLKALDAEIDAGTIPTDFKNWVSYE